MKLKVLYIQMYRKYWDRQALANSVHPEQNMQKTESDRCRLCLQLIQEVF